MITDAFIAMMFYAVKLLTLPLSVLPDVSLNSGFAPSVATAIQYLSNLNTFLPISALFSVLGLTLTFEVGVLSYKLIMWVIRRVPGQG